MAVERALISTFDKTGLDAFARGLSDLGVELVASGGTAAYIAELGIDVTPVEDVTDFPELLGGRVKTLHPRVHAGILARRDRRSDLQELREQGIRPFDLVCVNLYPFAQVAGQKDVREEDAVEMIDIGGPAMLRAAAKNFVHVAPVWAITRTSERRITPRSASAATSSRAWSSSRARSSPSTTSPTSTRPGPSCGSS